MKKSNKKYSSFLLSFKLMLKRGNEILILTESYSKCLDLPGGRMERGEEELPIKDVFKREIAEELGRSVKYEVLRPIFQYRRFNTRTKKYVLMTVYEGKYISGEIKLSPEHEKYERIDLEKHNLEKRNFDNKEERSAFLDYFKNC